MRRDPRRALEWTKVYPAQRASIANLSLADAGRLLMLILYCAEKVNGGVIEGARNWTRKQWKNETLLDEIPRENQPNFWHFSQENFIVDAYDAEAENAAISKRKGGIKGREKQLKSAGYPAGYPTAESEKEIDRNSLESPLSECDSKSFLSESKESESNDATPSSYPKEWREVYDFYRSLGANCPIKDDSELIECAKAFFSSNAEVGWMTVNDDMHLESIHNWRGKARKYAESWVRNAPPAAPQRRRKKWNISNAATVDDDRYHGL